MLLSTPVLLCGLLAVSSVDCDQYPAVDLKPLMMQLMSKSPSTDYTVTKESMKGRLADVISSLAGLSSSVAQLEETSRELERSAEETAGDERVAKLANHMIDLQAKQSLKLRELTQNVSKKLTTLKMRLFGLSVQVQQMRGVASDDDSQGNSVERVVKFFSALQQQADLSQRFLPLAILYKANYTLFDMLQFDPSERNMNKLLTLNVSDPKL